MCFENIAYFDIDCDRLSASDTNFSFVLMVLL